MCGLVGGLVNGVGVVVGVVVGVGVVGVVVGVGVVGGGGVGGGVDFVGLVVGFAFGCSTYGFISDFRYGFSYVFIGLIGVVIGGTARSSRTGVGRRRQRTRGSARLGVVPLATTRSLRCVSVLLPGEEGSAWLAEVASCLAEAPDPGERRRYVRSYRLEAPRLIWVSWTEYLRGSRQRELS